MPVDDFIPSFGSLNYTKADSDAAMASLEGTSQDSNSAAASDEMNTVSADWSWIKNHVGLGASDNSSTLTAEQANAKYQLPGMTPFTGPVSTQSAQAVYDFHKQSLANAQIQARGPQTYGQWWQNAATRLGPSLLDPSNVIAAAAAIPTDGLSEFGLAARLGVDSVNAGLLQRAVIRAANGLPGNAVGGVASSGLEWMMAPDQHKDFGMGDFLAGALQNTVMGTVLHVAGGGLRDTGLTISDTMSGFPNGLLLRDILHGDEIAKWKNNPPLELNDGLAVNPRVVAQEMALGKPMSMQDRIQFLYDDRMYHKEPLQRPADMNQDALQAEITSRQKNIDDRIEQQNWPQKDGVSRQSIIDINDATSKDDLIAQLEQHNAELDQHPAIAKHYDEPEEPNPLFAEEEVPAAGNGGNEPAPADNTNAMAAKEMEPEPTLSAPVRNSAVGKERDRLATEELPKHEPGSRGYDRVQAQIADQDQRLRNLEGARASELRRKASVKADRAAKAAAKKANPSGFRPGNPDPSDAPFMPNHALPAEYARPAYAEYRKDPYGFVEKAMGMKFLKDSPGYQQWIEGAKDRFRKQFGREPEAKDVKLRRSYIPGKTGPEASSIPGEGAKTGDQFDDGHTFYEMHHGVGYDIQGYQHMLNDDERHIYDHAAQALRDLGITGLRIKVQQGGTMTFSAGGAYADGSIHIGAGNLAKYIKDANSDPIKLKAVLNRTMSEERWHDVIGRMMKEGGIDYDQKHIDAFDDMSPEAIKEIAAEYQHKLKGLTKNSPRDIKIAAVEEYVRKILQMRENHDSGTTTEHVALPERRQPNSAQTRDLAEGNGRATVDSMLLKDMVTNAEAFDKHLKEEEAKRNGLEIPHNRPQPPILSDTGRHSLVQEPDSGDATSASPGVESSGSGDAQRAVTSTDRSGARKNEGHDSGANLGEISGKPEDINSDIRTATDQNSRAVDGGISEGARPESTRLTREDQATYERRAQGDKTPLEPEWRNRFENQPSLLDKAHEIDRKVAEYVKPIAEAGARLMETVKTKAEWLNRMTGGRLKPSIEFVDKTLKDPDGVLSHLYDVLHGKKEFTPHDAEAFSEAVRSGEVETHNNNAGDEAYLDMPDEKQAERAADLMQRGKAIGQSSFSFGNARNEAAKVYLQKDGTAKVHLPTKSVEFKTAGEAVAHLHERGFELHSAGLEKKLGPAEAKAAQAAKRDRVETFVSRGQMLGQKKFVFAHEDGRMAALNARKDGTWSISGLKELKVFKSSEAAIRQLMNEGFEMQSDRLEKKLRGVGLHPDQKSPPLTAEEAREYRAGASPLSSEDGPSPAFKALIKESLATLDKAKLDVEALPDIRKGYDAAFDCISKALFS